MTLNYQEALKNAAKSMVRVKTPEHLIKMITRYLDREIGISHVSMIILNEQKDKYVFCDSKGVNKVPVSLVKIDKDSPLIRCFSGKWDTQKGAQQYEYLSSSQIDAILERETSFDRLPVRDLFTRVKKNMEIFKAKLLIPGFYKKELLGIFILGEKKDQSAYTEDEISFFQTLASDAAMSLKNAEFRTGLIAKIKELEKSLLEIKRLRERDKEKFLQTILTLAHTVDARDPYTYGHCGEVEKFGVLTATELGLDMEGEKGRILSSAFLLHDVGKLGVPDEVLHKQGPLNDKEWFIMKEHVKTGAKILENHDDFKEVSVVIMHHHENFDGTGYPYKLKGEEIPIQSRIISVVDAFHAMVSDRPYRKGLSYDFAINELKRCSGTQFDPDVVDAFLRVVERKITLQV